MVLQFALLATLAAGLTLATSSSAAQTATPDRSEPAGQSSVTESSGSGVSTQAPDSAKPEAGKEDEGENKFRHSAVVTAAAKQLHLPVETAARAFEFLNFAIIALAVGIPLFRSLPKVLRSRSQKLRNDIESARKVTEDANARLSAVEAKLSSLDDEIRKFRAEVESESLQDEARIKASLEEERNRIVAAAGQEIGVAAAQARRSLRHYAADLAIEQATQQLTLTPETDRALIAEFVTGVSGKSSGKGGLN
jgi:F-type H+-transporting ATPase subunit b